MQRPSSQRYYRASTASSDELDDCHSSRHVFSSEIPQAPGANGWECHLDGCGKVFPEQRDLLRHQRTVKKHNEPSHPCDYCGSTFTRKDALHRHIKSKHPQAYGSFSHAMSPAPPLREDDSPPTRYRFVEPVVPGRMTSSPTPSLVYDRDSRSNGYTSSSSSTTASDGSPPHGTRRLRPDDAHMPQVADHGGPGGFPWIYHARSNSNAAMAACAYEPIKLTERPRLPPLRSLELPSPAGRR